MTEKGSITMHMLAKMIDHSLLQPILTDGQILDGCALAGKYKTATACVKPYAVALARDSLAGSGVGVCSVIGFPHGNSAAGIKVAETRQAVRDGASEIDMVINIGKALGGDWDYVSAEIRVVNGACAAGGAILKVIFETDFLSDDQIVRLCEICSEIRVAFIKTSTGYGYVKQPDGSYASRGATDHAVSLMRAHADPRVQVKAAGGIRTLDDLLRFRALGAARIGATATEAILEEAVRRGYS
ncbi:MAG: deoxyribose-phosphate aldolase [Anaerolineales bacterium]|nr:deoxyribose-phosphate aldolase [Anaerolineales bacterium]